MAQPEAEKLLNLEKNGTDITGRVPATPEGMAMACGSLIIMALLPIFFGAFRSVKHHQKQQKAYKDSGKKPDTMSRKDAAMLPLIGSCTLFYLYVLFQKKSKEDFDETTLFLTVYFFFMGIFILTMLISPVVSKLLPSSVPLVEYHRKLIKKLKKDKSSENLIDIEFTSHDLISLVLCSLIGVWYILKKHWIANNMFGIAFAANGIELLHLNSVVTGFILLGGLFVYDIFWVFGTDVMVTVAKSFEAPIKLVFPEDLLEKGLDASNFVMLGLGDIVLPGIFIALLLRFDVHLKRNSRTYFNVSFFAYIMGLLLTMLVAHVFKHGQPALLYLVPACVGAPLLLALIKGDLTALFRYEDHPEEKENKEKDK